MWKKSLELNIEESQKLTVITLSVTPTFGKWIYKETGV